MQVSLRPLVDADLDAIMQMEDPESVRMAAFAAEDPTDRHASSSTWRASAMTRAACSA